MRLNFTTNDYLLTWNLLYGPSFSESVHKFKEKLYANYRKQYKSLAKDKDEMLLDIKNFIPDNDTLYNFVFETNIFTSLKEDSEKHRLQLLKTWDQYKKVFNENIKEIIKLPLKEEYNIVVLHPIMDSLLTTNNSTTLGWGYRRDLKNPILTIVNILYQIVKKEIGPFSKENQEIVEAILELAMQNELYTRIAGITTYLKGDKSLVILKKQIYPYWLMYLGCDKEDYPRYMMRDKIAFEIDEYPSDKKMAKLSLREFIEFCIRNQKRIIRINHLGI